MLNFYNIVRQPYFFRRIFDPIKANKPKTTADITPGINPTSATATLGCVPKEGGSQANMLSS